MEQYRDGVQISKYLPSVDTLGKYTSPGPRELVARERFRAQVLGCDYALVYSHDPQDQKLVIVPAWHNLASVPQANPGTHYSYAIFEGGSARPVLRDGAVSGANLVLFAPKIERFAKSLLAQQLQSPLPLDEFTQGIMDLVAVSGDKPFLSSNGKPIRAYIRPAAMRGEGAFGIIPKEEPIVLLSCVHWGWPSYLPERVYSEGAVAAAFLTEQRLTKMRGKLAGNYSAAAEIGNRARNLNADEVILFGPYTYDPISEKKEWVNYQEGEVAIAKLRQSGTIADGLGEDIVFFVLSSNDTIDEMWVQPLDTNILGGTTRAYLTKHMAPAIGIRVTEKPITIDDIRKRRIQAMCFVGNAVNIAPIRRIDLYDGNSTKLEELTCEVPKGVLDFVQRFEDEVSGILPPSHPNLLTEVNFDKSARAKFDEVYKNWL